MLGGGGSCKSVMMISVNVVGYFRDSVLYLGKFIVLDAVRSKVIYR